MMTTVVRVGGSGNQEETEPLDDGSGFVSFTRFETLKIQNDRLFEESRSLKLNTVSLENEIKQLREQNLLLQKENASHMSAMAEREGNERRLEVKVSELQIQVEVLSKLQ